MHAYKVICAIFATILCACTGEKSVEVNILPTQYSVGGFASPLATDAVNEVAKKNPGAVHIHACKTTPPERIDQFNTELKAKLNVKTTMTFTAEGCGTSPV